MYLLRPDGLGSTLDLGPFGYAFRPKSNVFQSLFPLIKGTSGRWQLSNLLGF